MDVVFNLTWLIPLFPLLAAAIVMLVPAVYYRKKLSARLTVGLMAVSLVLSTLVLIGTLAAPETAARLQGHGATHTEHGETGEAGHGEAEVFTPPEPLFNREFHWMALGQSELTLGFWVDPLSAAMVFMVSLVGLCIFVYSQGYMAAEDYNGEENRYSSFFSFLGLFAFSMLGLVIARDILLLFICWELVGLCSYLLIGFWNFKKSAYDAAIKAFIVTKIGDAGFFIGLFILYIYTGNMNIGEVIHNPAMLEKLATTTLPSTWPILGGVSVAALAAISLFIGTIGKSAQVPLHVWLPDAMEGPTPVSALIHAATMVAAGVFMVARMFPLFEAAGPGVMNFVAWIGGITALFAATIAVAQWDIKRVLAYSTISQLGYMVLGLGVGGYVAGFFHLLTHAFFKALLFLGSGAVIIGAHHVQDMREMGGLRERIPKTWWTYLIGTLALAGIFPLSGFWSKDEILLDAFKHNTPLYIIGTIAAFLTAFYMTRQLAMTFFGKPRSHGAEAAAEAGLFDRDEEVAPIRVEDMGGGGHGEHGHGEHHGGGALPLNMTLPLIVLAVCTVLFVLIAWPLSGGSLFSRFVGGHAAFDLRVAGISTAVALAGIGVGWLVYGLNQLESADDPDPLHVILDKVKLGWIWTLWEKKYYVDEVYHHTIVLGTHAFTRICAWVDGVILDGVVNLVAFGTRYVAQAAAWVDLQMVDGLVNVVGFFTGFFSVVQGWFDLYIVDGIVNTIARVTGWIGDRARRVQSGRVQDYLMLVLLGLLVIIGLFVYL